MVDVRFIVILISMLCLILSVFLHVQRLVMADSDATVVRKRIYGSIVVHQF